MRPLRDTSASSQSNDGDLDDLKLNVGDYVPGAMYVLLLVVALWRTGVHRPTHLTSTSSWSSKFGFHVFVLLFAVRRCFCHHSL
jgi:hypothetical protein